MKEFLLVDGYNLMHHCRDTSGMTVGEFEHERDLLVSKVADYAGRNGVEAEVVFDAYRQEGPGSAEQHGGLRVIFSAEGEKADTYIERRVTEKEKEGFTVTVVTSDRAEQDFVWTKGAVRMSVREFRLLLETGREKNRRRNSYGREKTNPLRDSLDGDVLRDFEKMRRGR